MNAPQIAQGQWIKIGAHGLDGVVFDIHRDGSLSVGYVQNQLKAIKEDVIWDGDRWQFATSGPGGSYLRGAEEVLVKRGPAR